MDYVQACSDEKIIRAAKLFHFPLAMQEEILLLKEEILADSDKRHEFVERCRLLYEEPDFDFGELKTWPAPREIGSMYYYLMLVAGADEIEKRMKRIAQERTVPPAIIDQTIYDISSDLDAYIKRTNGMPASSLEFRIKINYGGDYFRFGRLAFHLNRFQGQVTIYQDRDSGEIAIVDNKSQLLVDDRGYLSAVTFQGGENYQMIIGSEHKVLDVHIPGGASLEMDECFMSMRRGIKFFKEKFPEEQFDYFACFSWLMDARLPLLLSPESNIVRFQRLFRLFPSPLSANEVLFTNVFGYVPTDYNQLPEDTSLKRTLSEFLRNGKLPPPGGGGCFLSLREFSDTYGSL